MLEPEVMDEIGLLLEPRDFKYPMHELIWTAIDYMYRNDKPINVVALTEMLIKYKRLNEIDDFFGFLSDATREVHTTAHAKYHAEIIKKYSVRRRAVKAAEEIKSLADHHFDTEEEFFSAAEKVFDTIRSRPIDEIKRVKDTTEDYKAYLDAKEDYIPSGFTHFDYWAKGLGRGWLYILAARPSIGKTAKMLKMATSIARNSVGAVVIFSQEMKREALYNRIISSMTSIPLSSFRSKNLDPREREKVDKAIEILNDMPLYVMDKGSYSIDEIRAITRQIKRKEDQLGAIFVDYLGIMNIPIPKGQTYAQAIGNVSSGAKSIAMELNCPFVMLAQLNRDATHHSRPTLAHLRDSGAIEQDADVVELLWVDKDDERNDRVLERVITSTIAKGRDIGNNEFRFLFQGWIQHFKELPPK